MNAGRGTAITGSPYAWLRLAISLVLSTIASIGMWSAVVALPAVQADFGIDRATASLPFSFAFGGYALGGALMGRLADRHGIVMPATIGAVMLDSDTSPPAFQSQHRDTLLRMALSA